MKYIIILTFIFASVFGLLAQKPYIDQALHANIKSGDYYKATVPTNKLLPLQKLRKYCEENAYYLSEVDTRINAGFLGDREVVEWFTFLPMDEKKEFEEMYALNSGKEAVDFISRHPLRKERTQKQFYDNTVISMKQDISNVVDFFKTFPDTKYSSDLANSTVKWLEGQYKELFLSKISDLSILMTPDCNPKLDLCDETQLKLLYPKFLSLPNVFSKDDKNKLFFKILDYIPLFKTTVLEEYAQIELDLAFENEDPNIVTAFLTRFPNSILKPKALEHLKYLDHREYYNASSKNSVWAYQEYKHLYPKLAKPEPKKHYL